MKRFLTRGTGLETPVGPGGGEMLSPPRAEIISRVWQAIAFVEEARADLTGLVRASAARDAAAKALQDATQQMSFAAAVLVPSNVVRVARVGRVKPLKEAAQ